MEILSRLVNKQVYVVYETEMIVHSYLDFPIHILRNQFSFVVSYYLFLSYEITKCVCLTCMTTIRLVSQPANWPLMIYAYASLSCVHTFHD